MGVRAVSAPGASIGFGTAGLAGGTTTQLVPGQQNAAASALATRAGIFSNLEVSVATAPGAGQSLTYTLLVGPPGALVATTLTCTVSGASQTAASDTTHQVAIAAGQAWAIQFVSSASAAGSGQQALAIQFN